MSKPDKSKLIEPGDGNMSDPIDTIGYIGIEAQIEPEIFYNLLSLFKGDKFKSQNASFTISAYHYSLMEVLRNRGIVRAREADMIRAIVGIGILSKAKLSDYSRYRDLIEAILVHCKNHRKIENKKRFDLSLNRLNLEDKKTINYLKLLVESYGNNEYGREIWGRIYRSWDIPKLKFKERDLCILDSIRKKCFKLTQSPLTSAMYRLKRDSNNKALKARLSERFHIILHKYENEFLEHQSKSEIIRGCFIAGLFCLSKWVLRRRICKIEYDFFKIIDGIDSYAART